ncbi:MAG: hypothetical protein N4A71_10845 [Carboxylicivirga sp.]|nr:hypothetical protein [Carboxylicivirga sp.]
MKNNGQISIIWKRLALVLLLVSVVQIANNALCFHTHFVDGKIYGHAHPGDQNKDHSKYELSFYAQLQLLNTYDVPQLLSDVVLIFERDVKVEIKQQPASKLQSATFGRAPPLA